ncbi:MAG: FAD-dependent oxidoreductase [Proteobacteria bacterium]|nr:FAD-dependent oxidoreductase [Pseudomonadota bacterium]
MTTHTTRDRPIASSIPQNNDVVIVGSGLGGLTCALELARHGLKVCVLEQHRVVGGYAHSFRRRGYHFDISLHVVGSMAPGNMTHEVLSTLGVFDKLQVRRRETLFSAEFPDSQIVVLPNRLQDLLDELVRRFPAERSGLIELFDFLPKLKSDVVNLAIDPDSDSPIEERISTKYLEKTFGEVLDEYITDPKLVALLGQLWMYIGLPSSLATATFSTCVFCSSFIDGSYYINGGGAALVRAMVERLRELDGECITRAAVKRITVEDQKVTGVELDSGEFVAASTVVSNANPFQTFFDLIPGDEISKIYRFRLKQMESSLSLYSLYLGLDCLPSQLGVPAGNFFYNHKIDCEDAYRRAVSHDIENSDWCVTNYEKSDASMCPPSAGILSFAEMTPVGDWLDMDEETYAVRKLEVLKKLQNKYCTRFPGLEDHIVVSEFATPRTMARYTRNHRGAVYGLAQTVEQSNSKRLRNRSAIQGLFLTGAWTWAGGGYEGAMMSGIQTAGVVLRDIDAPSQVSKIKLCEPLSSSSDKATNKTEIEQEDEPFSSALSELGPEGDHYRFRVGVNVFGDDLNSRGNADVSSFLRYLDRGRVEAIETICQEAGNESWLKRYTVNVYRIVADCATIVGLGNRLEVRTGLRKISSHRASFDQRIVNLATDEVVMNAMVEVLFLNEQRKLVPVPDELTSSDAKGADVKTSKREPGPFSDGAQFPFRSLFRVYYEDTDCQGITYHVSYARFCERALQELVSTVWPEMTTKAWIMRNKVGVAKLNIRYLNPSTLGDHLEVRTGVLDLSSHRITFGQRIAFQHSSDVIADITTEVEFRDENERLVPVPAQVLDATFEELPPGS